MFIGDLLENHEWQNRPNYEGDVIGALALTINGTYHHFSQFYDQRPSLYGSMAAAPFFMLTAELSLLSKGLNFPKWQIRSLFTDVMKTCGQNPTISKGVVKLYEKGLKRDITHCGENYDHLFNSAQGAILHEVQLKIGPIVYNTDYTEKDKDYFRSAFSVNIKKVMDKF